MNRWILDTEGNGLLDEITRIWCIVCRNIDNPEEVRTFLDPDRNPDEFREFSRGVDLWVGHNIFGYDERVLTKFGLHGIISLENTIDTLVFSRLIHQAKPSGHSLEAFGETIGIPKVIIKDFSRLTPELLKRCIEDTLINYHLYKSLEKYLKDFSRALSVETSIEYSLSREITQNGFLLDEPKLRSLHSTLSVEVDKLTAALQEVFPPKPKFIKEITPRETKFGTLNASDFRWLNGGDLTPYSVGSPFSRFLWVEFNPGSPQQVVDKLNKAGWKPFEKTDGHKEAEKEGDPERLKHFKEYGWAISEDNLATLPDDAPEAARTLVRWLMLSSRVRKIEEWFKALKPDGAVHGTIIGLGTWTHRCSHTEPNMGNIPSVAPKYNPNGPIYPEASQLGKTLRSLWVARPGRALVGTDADSIQLRVLAHYMDDPKFTEALINGNKENGTDAHSLNKQALGDVCATRDVAKTFIYAWLLGAGIAKVAQILSCTAGAARDAIRRFVEAYPGLKRLKEETIRRDARRGYFEGFDGRKVIPRGRDVDDKAYSMLSGYLQNGEAVIMKHAAVKWLREAKAEGLPYWWVNFVHDEYQTEAEYREGDLEPVFKDQKQVGWKARSGSICDRLAELQRDAIAWVGDEFGLKCPMLGQSKFGFNWLETH